MKTYPTVTGIVTPLLLFSLFGTLHVQRAVAQERPASEALVYEADMILLETRKVGEADRQVLSVQRRKVELDPKTGKILRWTRTGDDFTEVVEVKGKQTIITETRPGKSMNQRIMDEAETDAFMKNMKATAKQMGIDLPGKKTTLKKMEKVDGLECTVEVWKIEAGAEKAETIAWIPKDRRLRDVYGFLQMNVYRVHGEASTLVFGMRITNIRGPKTE